MVTQKGIFIEKQGSSIMLQNASNCAVYIQSLNQNRKHGKPDDNINKLPSQGEFQIAGNENKKSISYI